LTQSEWLVSVFCKLPVVVSHSLMVWSEDADAICLPSGEKATALIEPKWSASVFWRSPVVASHSLMVIE
jgi:hypothetical protein